MKRTSLFVLAITMAAFISAAPSKEKQMNSPFLGDTKDFKKADFGKNLLWQRHGTKKAVDYEKFIFDPVLIYQSHNSVLPQMSEAELKNLGSLFKKLSQDTFKSSVQIVETPGADVLRVRFAIRGMKPGRYYLDAAGSHEIKPDTKLAAVIFEAEAIDSLTGERVVALVQNISNEQAKNVKREDIETTVQNSFAQWLEMLKQTFRERKLYSAIPE